MTSIDELIEYTDEELEEIERIGNKITAPLGMPFSETPVAKIEEPETPIEEDISDLGEIDEISGFDDELGDLDSLMSDDINTADDIDIDETIQMDDSLDELGEIPDLGIEETIPTEEIEDITDIIQEFDEPAASTDSFETFDSSDQDDNILDITDDIQSLDSIDDTLPVDITDDIQSLDSIDDTLPMDMTDDIQSLDSIDDTLPMDITDDIQSFEESGEDFSGLDDLVGEDLTPEESPPVEKDISDNPLSELNALTIDEPDSVDFQDIALDDFIDSGTSGVFSNEIDDVPSFDLDDISGGAAETFDESGIGDLDDISSIEPLGEGISGSSSEVSLESGEDLDIPDLSDISVEDVEGIPEAIDDDVPDIDLGGIVSGDSEFDVPALDDSITADAVSMTDDDFSQLGEMDAFSGSTPASSGMSMDEIPDDLGSIEPLDDTVSADIGAVDDSFTVEPLDDIDMEIQQEASSGGEGSEESTLELSESQIKKLKKAILIYNPGLRDAIKDTVLNDSLPQDETRQLVDMILSGQPESSIHKFLEKKLGRKIRFVDEAGTDGRRVISSRPEYTREGRERQKKLLKVTGIFGGAAIITFILAIVSYYLIYIPFKAKKEIDRGSQYILEHGDYAKKINDFNKAEKIFQNVNLDYKKDYLYGYNRYGRAYLDKKQYKRSLDKLNKAYNINRSHVSTLNNLGYYYSKVSPEYYNQIKYNVDPWYYMEKGLPEPVKKKSFLDRAYNFIAGKEEKKEERRKALPKGKVRKQLDVAINFYKRALLIDNNNITAINGIGNAYYYQGQYVKAQEYYKSILKVKPESIEGYSGLVNLYIERDSFDLLASIHRILKDKKLEVELPSSLLGKMASYYLSKIRTDKFNLRVDFGVESPRLKDADDNIFPAVRSVLRALNERDPSYPPLQLHSARLSKAQKNYKVMKIYLDKAISLEPGYFGALHLLGEYFYDTREPVQAYKYLNKAIKAYGNQPEFTMDEFYFETEKLGKSYALLGNIFYYFFDKIKYRFGDLEDDEVSSELDKLSNYNIARDKYEKALSEGYESSELHYNLGRIYYLNKEFDKSLKQWLSLYEDFVDHPELMFSLGNSFYHTGNYGASKGEYLKLISVFEREAEKISYVKSNDPRHVKIFQTLASVYNNLGAVYQKENNATKSSLCYWKSIAYSKRINRENEYARVNLSGSIRRGDAFAPIFDNDIAYSIDVYREDQRRL